MKRFLIRIGCFVAIQLIIALLVFWLGRADRGDHYLASAFDKHDLLTSTDAPRLIVVGGSNVAFGINSEILAAELPYVPVNLGLHVNLGLDFPLRMVEDVVRTVDLIILSPEYNVLITDNVHGSRDYLTLMCQQWPDARKYAEGKSTDLRMFLDEEAIWHAHIWLRRARRKILGQDARNPIYSRAGFNKYGDMVAHYEFPRDEPPDIYSLPKVSDEHLELAVERMNQFADFCRSRGAEVVFSYPPVPRGVLMQSQESISRVEEVFRAALSIPVISGPADVAYERTLFYDTIYHLTQQGAASRSQLLASRLAAHLPNRIPDSDSQGRLQAARQTDGDSDVNLAR